MGRPGPPTPAAVVDPPSVAEYVSKARRIAAPLNNAFLTANIVMATGMVEIAAGRYDVARAQFEHTRELAVQSRDLYTEGMAIRAPPSLRPRPAPTTPVRHCETH